MRKSYQGLYKPTNPKKYVGNHNQIVYRSLLERRFMRYCDLNPDIVAWASEEIAIPYTSPIDNRRHRYFPDFVIKTVTGRRVMIEIKPSRKVTQPKRPKKKTKSYLRESMEFIKNQAKWNAANQYCIDNDIEFKIITEKQLGNY